VLLAAAGLFALLLPSPLPSEAPAAASRQTFPGQLEWVGAIHGPRDVTGKGSWLKRMLKAVVGLDDRQRRILLPHGLTVDSRGRLLVADTRARVVHVFDSTRRRYQRLRPPASDPFAAPIAVVTDAQGRIYVSDSVRSRVFVFAPGGKFLHTLGGLDRQESIFKRATGLGLDSERKRLYVVDTIAMRVVALSLEGKVLGRFGQPGRGPGEFNYPTHIAVGPDGTLWVTDSLNFRVQHFTSEGKFLSAFGRAGNGAGDFDKAKGIALDSEGNVYVVEGRNDRVQVFDAAGRLLFVFGVTGTGAGEFFLPTGIAIGPDNRIYVADSYNRRVQIFRYQPGTAGAPGGN
jgi:DNA-binding beta-propeller fold protein YncE